MPMTEYEFVLTGIRPILFHYNNLDFRDRIVALRKKMKSSEKGAAGDDRNVPGLPLSCLYLDDEGNVVVPGDNIDKMLSEAGSQLQVPGKRATQKKLVESSVLCRDAACTFEIQDDKGKWGRVWVDADDLMDVPYFQLEEHKPPFKCLVKPVKIKGNSHIRVRPRFQLWRVSGAVQVTSPAVDIDALFAQAEWSGLLDWRPRFGRFEAVVTKT